MKIIAFSDTHGKVTPTIPECDLLIFAGDFSAIGSYSESVKFINTFDTLPGVNKIIVPGNHDYYVEMTDKKNTYLEECFELEGINFMTSSYTPEFCNWNYMLSERELRILMKFWPTDVNVLITHGPPYGILDMNKDGEHCGSKALLEYVERVTPDVHIFGHIHHSFGHTEVNGTKFYNVSLLDDDYKYVNPITEIYYDS